MKAETSPEQKILDRKNKYLLKRFNITLDQKETMRRAQNDLCLICGKPLDTYGPCNVDHYHAHLDVVHAETPLWSDLRLNFKWEAWMTDELGVRHFLAADKTKAGARRKAMRIAMPQLIRALLCVKCNKGLGYIERFFDAARHPENLDAVKAYFVRRLEKVRSGGLTN